jgi:hypothetical protein
VAHKGRKEALSAPGYSWILPTLRALQFIHRVPSLLPQSWRSALRSRVRLEPRLIEFARLATILPLGPKHSTPRPVQIRGRRVLLLPALLLGCLWARSPGSTSTIPSCSQPDLVASWISGTLPNPWPDAFGRCEAAAEVEPTTGAVVHAFTTGAVVQVFLLVGNVPSSAWSGDGQGKT